MGPGREVILEQYDREKWQSIKKRRMKTRDDEGEGKRKVIDGGVTGGFGGKGYRNDWRNKRGK